MVKLWDCYKDCDDYISKSISNGYTFGIAKTCPKSLESERNLKDVCCHACILTPTPDFFKKKFQRTFAPGAVSKELMPGNPH